MEEKYELKAGAIVALLLKASTEKENIDDELTYVLSDLTMTPDAYKLCTALAGMTATSIIMLAQAAGQDPVELWTKILDTTI